MKYFSDENRIFIEVSEFVAIARRGISATQSYDEDEPYLFEYHIPNGYSTNRSITLDSEFSCDGISFVVSGKVLSADTDSIDIFAPVLNLREAKNKETVAQWRAVAFILGAIYAKKQELSSVTLNTVYYSEQTREHSKKSETVTAGKLYSFFEKCKACIPDAGRAEIERVTVRIPSMKNVKFPYEAVRSGQSEFIRASYRTIAKGGELYATAPTGTGKTVSALFPAIRALGDGRCEKVFYLTPKTTTADAARECLDKFAKNGAKIRGVILIAKDRICMRGGLCKENKKLCPTAKENQIHEAAMALFREEITTVTAKDIQRIAEKYTVCPYELSLTYSELCDVVICDFNYLFDPQVYIRRFFTRGGSYAFLIDEAHNLCERAREMYSASITLDEISFTGPLGEFSELSSRAKELSQILKELLGRLLCDEIRSDENDKPTGLYHSRSLPNELYAIFEKLTEVAEDELTQSFRARDDEAQLRVSFIRDYLFKVKKFYNAICRFDEGFEFFAHLEGEKLTAKVFCLDTGGVIKERLALGKASVIFSGTLSPISYYRSVLGGDNSSSVLELDSPFSSEQLSVSVMHNITTRYSERAKSLPAICRVIAATLSAKRGNYMIFSSSFAYAEALYKAFSAKYPKIHSILQRPNMSAEEKSAFLNEFSESNRSYLAAFCVTGGIYSEGIDLTGDKLIGAVIVGIGIPALSYEREAISAYYDERLEMGVQYAYLYPGMNRVLQAAGRVIRTENDKGVIVLIDDRFDDPLYKKTVPSLWKGMEFIEDASELRERLDEFWIEE